VKLIAQQSAGHVVTLKKNEGNLEREVEKLFSQRISTVFQGIGIAQCLMPS
jgi:hypothetical protein